MSSEKTKDDYHAEGQRDGSKNETYTDYTPGIGSIFDSSEKRAEDQENADAYRSGWDNGYKQR